MKDNSNTPFWGKQKPLRHYFKNGSHSFSVKGDKLFCKVTITTTNKKCSITTFEVKNKLHLDIILREKTFGLACEKCNGTIISETMESAKEFLSKHVEIEH